MLPEEREPDDLAIGDGDGLHLVHLSHLREPDGLQHEF